MKKLFILLCLVLVLVNLTSAFNWNDNHIEAYWSFNDGSGTNVDDNVDHINNGTTEGSPSWINGILGYGLDFDNINDWVNITDSSGLFNSDQTSISLWLHFNHTVATMLGYDIIFNSLPTTGYYMGTQPLNNMNLQSYAGGTSLAGATYPGNLTEVQVNDWATNNTWTHLVITMDSSGDNRVYINGGNYTYFGTTAWTKDPISYLTIGTDLSNYWYGGIDEFGIWNRTLSASEVLELYNSGNGLAAEFGFSVSLNLPNNNTNITNQQIFNVSANPDTYNLTNATIYVWYSNNTLYNTTTNSLTGDVTNGTQWNITFESIEDGYKWNARVCQGDGASGNCSFGVSNYTFNVKKIVEVNQTYFTPVLGGTIQDFQMIVNSSLGYTVIIPYFYYNGTSYEGSLTKSGQQYTFSHSISLLGAEVIENIPFYWNLSLSDGTYFISNSYTQTLNNISIDNCGTYTNQIFNFTILNEENQINISNTTIEYAFNIYDTSRTNKIFSYNSTSKTNPTLICLSTPLTSSTNYSMDARLKYYGNSSYIERYYNFLNFTMANSTLPQNITLYDAKNTSTLPFLLTFRDSQSALANGILIYVNKQYLSSNDFKTVEVPITDTNGQTILNLVKNTVVYNLIMVDISGTVVASFNNLVAFCQDYTIGSCSIDLSAPGQGQTIYNYNNDIGISYGLSYTNSSKIVSLAFNSLDSSSKTVRMIIRTENQFQNKTVCDSSLTALTGTINCNISSYVVDNQVFFVDIYSNTNFVETITINTNPFYSTLGGSFGLDGAFMALLIILTLALLFAQDRQTLLISLGIGWVTVVALGLISGPIIGMTSGGIWLIITILIFLWKLKKEEST